MDLHPVLVRLLHLVDSILLALLYAVAVYPKLPEQGSIEIGALAGILYGVVLWIVLAMLIVMPLMGSPSIGRVRHLAIIAALCMTMNACGGAGLPTDADPTVGTDGAAFLAIPLTDVRTGETFTLGGFPGKVTFFIAMAVW